MRSVGIKVLKNKLSQYLKAVAAGETLRVTDRGKVVAEIVPPKGRSEHEAAMTDAERQWAELVRQGVVTPAKRPANWKPPRRFPMMTLEELMKEIDADREDRV